MIYFKNVSFCWEKSQRHSSISEISFEVETGRLVGVFGRSGSGKSTILRLASGEISPLEGEVAWAVAETDVVYHDQQQKLLPWLSAEANVTRLAPARGYKDNVRSIIKVCGINEFAERDATRLSGGQRARVALARTLASPAKFKLLDEPFAGVDLVLQTQIIDHLAHTPGYEGGMITSHDPGVLVQLCDNVICLKAGDGRVGAEIYEIDGELTSQPSHIRRNSALFVEEVKRLQGFIYD